MVAAAGLFPPLAQRNSGLPCLVEKSDDFPTLGVAFIGSFAYKCAQAYICFCSGAHFRYALGERDRAFYKESKVCFWVDDHGNKRGWLLLPNFAGQVSAQRSAFAPPLEKDQIACYALGGRGSGLL